MTNPINNALVNDELQRDNALLRERLLVAEGTLGAIRRGEVDSLVFHTPAGPEIVTLADASNPDLAFRILAEAVPQLVWMCQPDGSNSYFNQRWVEYTGLTLAENYGWGWNTPFHPDDQQPALTAWAQAVATGGDYRIECRLRAADGSYRWFLTKGVPLRDAEGAVLKWFGTCTDIDDLKGAEATLRASLEENQVLLREIHHRVTNNLQVISSLLDLQSQSIREPMVAALFRDSQNRVRSMALVHEFLYQSESLSSIDFGAYIGHLVGHLAQTYGADSGRVRLDLELKPVRLSVDTAVPAGLIVNELVSNCLKYAFPEGRQGVITLRLGQEKEDAILVASDDGIGMPEGVDFRVAKTFGLRLVAALTDQLHGTARIDRQVGTTVTVTFPLARKKGVKEVKK